VKGNLLTGVIFMPKGVKCSVADCSYWAKGNQCHADQIMIDVDKHANSDYSAEFADGLGSDHRDIAGNAAATCCHTYEKRK
jgi:hypothetical protein